MVFEEKKKEEEKPKEEPKEEKPMAKPEEKPPVEEKKEEAKQEEKPPEFDAKMKCEELEKSMAELAGKVSMVTEALDKLLKEEEEEVEEMNEVKPPESPAVAVEPKKAEEAMYSKDISALATKVETLEKQLAQFANTGIKKTLSSGQNVQVEESDAVRNLRKFMSR